MKKAHRLIGLFLVALTITGSVTGCADDEQRVAIINGVAFPDYKKSSAIIGYNTSTATYTGVKENITIPLPPIDNTDSGDIDKLMGNATIDVAEFWQTAAPKDFGVGTTGLPKLLSWDSKVHSSATFCGRRDLYEFVNAAFCMAFDTIGWDRGLLIPELINKIGKIVPILVLAHEYGHRLQWQIRKIAGQVSLEEELRADCLSGVYLRWAAEGRSQRIQIAEKDLGGIIIASLSVRDSRGGSQEAHGSGMERTNALLDGFNHGSPSCQEITNATVLKKRREMPELYDSNLKIDTSSYEHDENSKVAASLQKFFNLPQLKIIEKGKDCATTPAKTAYYCPETNEVVVNNSELTKIGENGRLGSRAVTKLFTGNYSALAIIASRFALAYQRSRGLQIDTPTAGLQAACLTGAWMRSLKPTEINVNGSDHDEILSGLAQNGMAAADLQSRTVVSAFTRVQAYLAGVQGKLSKCEALYSH